jgi:hypothetical protein
MVSNVTETSCSRPSGGNFGYAWTGFSLSPLLEIPTDAYSAVKTKSQRQRSRVDSLSAIEISI